MTTAYQSTVIFMPTPGNTMSSCMDVKTGKEWDIVMHFIDISMERGHYSPLKHNLGIYLKKISF